MPSKTKKKFNTFVVGRLQHTISLFANAVRNTSIFDQIA